VVGLADGAPVGVDQASDLADQGALASVGLDVGLALADEARGALAYFDVGFQASIGADLEDLDGGPFGLDESQVDLDADRGNFDES